jgi:hypothetical protein
MREVVSGRNVRFHSHRLCDRYLEVTVRILSLETLVYRTKPAPICRAVHAARRWAAVSV